ncbi:hypothetical protein BAUCODRAFT_30688 [Baudoinia panamericana UAMH 10762]|uniref:Uncharacterized protein n=1 Tax=Baudoinia panamericana (strain UAMH 10762) TaxID=717646 RepID=M2NL65_BAUPA|nr:uncharacterized protein BAUCODRAFT_30688 [Baudoinia panamericana UAMH 10762]EMD00220.1 hypothetical protein BAUCODRAFT_30688 [Baudoinia panamericana UAMH 10762]
MPSLRIILQCLHTRFAPNTGHVHFYFGKLQAPLRMVDGELEYKEKHGVIDFYHDFDHNDEYCDITLGVITVEQPIYESGTWRSATSPTLRVKCG